MDALGLALGMVPRLVQLITEAVDAGARDQAEAERIALQHLHDEKALVPVLPTIKERIARARRPAAERDADQG